MNPGKKNIGIANDEVEELLKAAEDAALLNLNINAHKVHGVSLSSDLNPTSSLHTRVLGNMKPNEKKKKKKNTDTDTGVVNDDEVEELLRAAEDEALLRLSVGAHSVRGSSSDLHPNLHNRFQALKAGPKKTTKTPSAMTKTPPPQQPPPQVKVEDEGEDDLFARFAALKASIPKPSSSSSGNVTLGNIGEHNASGLDNIDGEDEEDEVEKVIRWAKDAARLDPSPASDEDDEFKDGEINDDSEKSDVDDDVDDNCEKSDVDDDRVLKNPKGRRK